MAVNGVDGSSTSYTTQSDMKKSTGLDKDDFLKLFITQLKNQDPLNPQDGTEFIGQLAQLTQVEQSYNVNKNLQSILDQQGKYASMSAVSFIGKDAQAAGSTVSLTPGVSSTLSFSLPVAAKSGTVMIQNASGQTVRTLTLKPTAAGSGSVLWDGKDNSGTQLPGGTYRFSVAAKDAEGRSFDGSTIVSGRVTAMRMDGSSVYLTLGGQEVPLENVLTVNGAA